MKKLSIGLLVTLVLFSIVSSPALAGTQAALRDRGPYEGTFSGYVYGDKGSRAELTLDLTHRGDLVTGTAELGEGLYVSAGRCGGSMLAPAVQEVRGETLPRNPNMIQAETEFTVSGIKIGVELVSDLSKDGETLEAEVEIDIPWICGRDPVLTGTLSREN